jgi:hypothetical protein
MFHQESTPENIRIVRILLQKYPPEDSLGASAFVQNYWRHYQDEFTSNNSMNGAIFENLIMLALARAGIDAIYYQTELTFVHSAIFDIFLYSPAGSVALSIKTTLRERWKQADLEALAIKQVHKETKCYVLTLSHSEVKARRSHDRGYAGLDGFVLADTEEFDVLVAQLASRPFYRAGRVPIVQSDQKYYNAQQLLGTFHLKS